MRKTSHHSRVPRYLINFLLIAFSLHTVAGVMAGEKDSVDLTDVWVNTADSLLIEATVAFKKAKGVDERSRALAGAVLALARPPISESDWDEIEPVLAKLAEGDDAIAARALYLQARMYQVHLSIPDYGKAEELFREVARRWPASHWAQLGFTKLGLVKLFALPEPTDAGGRLQEVVALLGDIQEPTLRRDLQLQIGWAGMFYERPLDEVLPHLIAADAVPGMMGITPEDLKIQIGELSFRAGHLEQAKRYFEEFLAVYPSNTRKFNVQQQLLKVLAALGEAEAVP